MATMPSPPGRFSTTTDVPFHLADSLSLTRRAVMSAPEPGPIGRTNLTGREGQALCARAKEGSASAVAADAPPTISARRVVGKPVSGESFLLDICHLPA